MKTVNENSIKRSLLYMNYDSKKTLSENLDRIILNEDKTNKSYLLAVLTNGPKDTSKQLKGQEIPVGSEISKNGDFVDVKSGFINYRFDCETKIFTSTSSSVTPVFNIYDDTTWVSRPGKVKAGSEMEDFLLTEYCSKGKSSTSSFDWMANKDDGYWKVLKTSLEKNSPLIPSVNEGTDTVQGPYYYWGDFTIARNNSNNFVSYGVKPPLLGVTAKIDPTNYNGKYAGQPALSDIKLIVNGTNEKMSLLDFISKYTPKKDEKVVDKTKSEVKTTTPKKITTPNTGWNETCQGTYSMSCKTPEVGRVQQCLKDQGLYPYKVDDKFGKLTRNAVYNKLGKSSFTDADIETICKTTSGGGGQDDFDSDMGSGSGDSTIDDKTWTGDVY